MRRFKFRLERLERWRRQGAEESRREHELSLRTAAAAERQLVAQDAQIEDRIEEDMRHRASGALPIEAWIASEDVRRALNERREALETRYRATLVEVERSLELLIEARRGLSVIEALGRARWAAWRREVDSELQKAADEAHRAKLFRESGVMDQEVSVGPGDWSNHGLRRGPW